MAIKDESLNSLCCKLDILEQTQSPPWYVHPLHYVWHLHRPTHFHCMLEEVEQDTFCRLSHQYHHHHCHDLLTWTDPKEEHWEPMETELQHHRREEHLLAQGLQEELQRWVCTAAEVWCQWWWGHWPPGQRLDPRAPLWSPVCTGRLWCCSFLNSHWSITDIYCNVIGQFLPARLVGGTAGILMVTPSQKSLVPGPISPLLSSATTLCSDFVFLVAWTILPVWYSDW